MKEIIIDISFREIWTIRMPKCGKKRFNFQSSAVLEIVPFSNKTLQEEINPLPTEKYEFEHVDKPRF